MKLLLIILGTVAVNYSFAQSATVPVELEKWNDKPAIHVIASKYKDESAVVLLDKRRVEYTDEAKDQMTLYKTLHKIVHVNDDRGIESFNKVYLGVSDNSDIVDIRARTILPNGKIIEIDKGNIKDLKEEDGNTYKIFALEGLEKGCEVEYYYTFKREASFFGREVIQGRFPVMDALLEVRTPPRLVFELKSFNSTAKVIDTVLDNKRIFSTEQKDISGVDDEKYATYNANLKRVEYKLAYNNDRGQSERLFTWNELAKRIYNIYTSYTDKELKKTEDLINANGWKKLVDEKQKIVAVENFIKKNYATREDISTEDAEDVEKIIKNKIASYRGIIRLYGIIYEKLSIPHEFVLTSDRNDFSIDKSFENWNNCDQPIIYFPDTKKFMAPTRLEFRYPWINPFWGGTNGLYCKGTTIGKFNTAYAEIKPIPLEDYSESYNSIESSIRLNSSADTVLVDMKQKYGGYAAAYYRAVFNFTSSEQQRAALKDLVKFGTNSENIVSSKIENADFESYSDNKPFLLSASVKASELLEQAGNKILVKIGEIIGPQAEMYQEKPRQFPMEIEFPHTLERKIDFQVPDGYIVKNLNDLVLNNVFKENNEITMGFSSSYKQEGNIVKIYIMEEYRRTFYPLSQYEAFKKIINTSADFNKVVLVLEKKQ